MEVIDINKISKPYKNAVISIGNFDGVHKGHQVLLDTVRKKADAINGTAIAMTFEPHPIRVLKNGNPPHQITLYEQKVELLSQTRLDLLIRVPFTDRFAQVTAEEFVGEWLLKRIGMKIIVVGNDYSFGKNRKGDVAFLNALTVTPNAIGRGCPIHLVIFPKFTRDAQPALIPMSRAQAAFDLHHVCFNLFGCTTPGVDVLATMIRGASCYRLISGELNQTCDLLETLVERPARQRARSA